MLWFCKVCLVKDKPMETCPVCKKCCKRRHSAVPPLTMELRSRVKINSEQRPPEQTFPSPQQPECSLHSEKLRLFCLDHQELLCRVCRDSRTHTDHSFRPIEEAAQDLREQLGSSMEDLQNLLEVLDQRRTEFDSTVGHISAQAQHTQTQIRNQFDKLHQFLREEEESRMKTLREEEEQKIQRIKDKMAALSRHMQALSQTISETEEQLRAADISFLLQYKTAVERVQCCHLVEVPRMERGALIDQTKHLGNLGFNIWRNMKSLVHFYPVILNPNNAGPRLVLSEDLSSVRRGEEQKVPQNPGRNGCYTVDGSEVFVSGTHSWDVEVGGNKHWEVGVMEPLQRQWFYFCISFTDGKYRVDSRSVVDKQLSVKNLQRIRMKLDFDTKTVTITDPDTNTELQRFTENFTDGLTPFFATEDNVRLKILPRDISVTV